MCVFNQPTTGQPYVVQRDVEGRTEINNHENNQK